jgi:predicted 2-oxoglutarate/Fe(II)-dependent dioxygenase YbiX
MKVDLNKYIKVYSSFFEKELCNNTIKDLKNCEKEWYEHTFYNPLTNTNKNRSGEQEFSVSELYTENNKIIMDKIWNGIRNYVDYLDIPFFTSWSGYSAARYNIYRENKKMAEHIDHIQSIFDGERKGIPTLSLVGILNDDYEGGEFIMFGKEQIKLKQGDLLIFPSNFLFKHKVNEVKKGTRYSFVSWVW